MREYQAGPYVPDPGRVKSPLRYPGGKFYALKYIMPYIQCVEHDEYREPFLGGGAVYFAKKKAAVNILNDLDSDIMNVYQVIQDEREKEQLIGMLEQETATKERHGQMKEFVPETVLEEAYKTYYLNRTSYCGIINTPAWGYAKGKSSPPENWGNFIRKASAKLQGARLFSLDYREILSMPAEGKRVLMYLDPPYFHADQKRAYKESFEPEDHLRLAEDLRQTPYLFCLSYDDCDEIREMYDWAYQYDVSWLYNTDNRSGGCRKAGKELIITNYKVLRRQTEGEP